MAVVLTAPGVYVHELGSGVRTITGVATSVTAFVGRCRRGTVAADAAPILVSSWADFVRQCGDVWADSELSTAVLQYFQAGGATGLIVRVVHTNDGVPANNASAASFDLGGGTVLTARSPGSWANSLRATVSFGGALDAAGPQEFHLTISVVDPDDGVISVAEEHRGVSVDPTSARFVTRVLQTRSRAVVASSVGVTRPIAVGDAPPGAGRDGLPPTDAEVETALARLRLADIVNLLCIPPYTDPEVGPNLSVYTAALALCEELRAMLLVDPPQTWGDTATAADMTGITGLQSPNTIMMYPAALAPDPARDGLERAFAPSPFVAGVIARTDATRGVWVAPAGMDATLRGMTGLAAPLTDGEVGQLNQRGVNSLVARPIVGPTVWGARTAVGADTRGSDWKYVPVRRLALYIEETIVRNLKWAVFEPNDAPLWAEIRGAVGTFMQGLFAAGALAGEQVRDAYEVVCDRTTTTEDDTARGVVNVLVRFAPLKPAEFVVLKFQQMAGQSGA